MTLLPLFGKTNKYQYLCKESDTIESYENSNIPLLRHAYHLQLRISTTKQHPGNSQQFFQICSRRMHTSKERG